MNEASDLRVACWVGGARRLILGPGVPSRPAFLTEESRNLVLPVRLHDFGTSPHIAPRSRSATLSNSAKNRASALNAIAFLIAQTHVDLFILRRLHN